MSRAPLLACPACARHVRVDEDACPFCGAALPSSFRDTTLPPTPSARLSRAALYALRVSALSVTTAACGGSVGASASRVASDAAPLLDATGPEQGDGAGPDVSFGVPVYGAPIEDAQPFRDGGLGDAGRPEDAAVGPEASTPDAATPDANGPSDARSQDVFLTPLYGSPAPPYGIPIYGKAP
ncbi:MAG: hypothetical protein M3O36_20995 [Myxococcota bacterium]|nr:hypothetical protein [Myxococcota bacterium]